MSTFILLVPPELVHHILVFCDPRTVANFSKLCRWAHELVYDSDDQYLWRELFLQRFDDPRQAIYTLKSEANSSASSYNWKADLQRRTQAELFALHFSEETYEALPERRLALETFVSAIRQALPGKIPDSQVEAPPSLNTAWLDRVLRGSGVLRGSPLLIEVQPFAQLRSHLALSHDTNDDEESIHDLRARRVVSRCFVYDIRNYTSPNNWGPFDQDGSVNWGHVEHLSIVVLTNLRELPGLWTSNVPPIGLENTRAFSAPALRGGEDWAGVEGTWRRYVCFMDYRDLFAFNYSNIASGPRNPIFFHDSRFREATRLIEVKLHLVSQAELCFHKPEPELENTNPQYPMLLFAGTSRGVSGNEARIEGNVKIGVDGTVRWSFGAIHDRSTLWCSQGVQIGGIASASGIVGNWSTSMHDQGDPVGPFWLWKVPDHHSGHLMDFT